jgi:ring-1,2-phenylacetyl-CoA epoxidase subunit PaaD
MVSTREAAVWELLKTIPDPEIPVLNVLDLGIVRAVHIVQNDLEIVITPTYSGCPAMNMIEMEIKMAFSTQSFDNLKVTTILNPAWTTDWITPEARQKLKDYGITPPQNKARLHKMLFETEVVPCPRCNATDTQVLSEFGSTACKSLHKCNECLEAFDYFKCH